MAVITHRLNDGTDKALCGEKLSCIPGADVWHILLNEQSFNDDEVTQGTRCADCVISQAVINYAKVDAKITLNTLCGKPCSLKSELVHKADLKAAFKIVEERDNEIATLRQDILHLERKLKRTEDSLDGAVDAGTAMINKINELTEENVRLENELHYAKAEIAPLKRSCETVASKNVDLMNAFTAIDHLVRNTREALKEMGH